VSVPLILVLHAACTWALVGLIWTIQVVHYPLFDAAASGDYARFQARHVARITWLVGPLMPAEALLATVLLLLRPAEVPPLLPALGLALLAVVWLSTALLQAPLHARLAERYDARLHRRLVGTNWIRTAAWTARGVVAGWMLLAVAG
jgi:hypothetical protein